MQKRYFVFTLLACSLAACSKSPLDTMQAKSVPMCDSLARTFGKGEWPLVIYDPTPEQQQRRGMYPEIDRSNGYEQQPQKARDALIAEGLVLAEPIKIDVLDPAGRPTGYTDPATRYSLTEAAKPFLRTTQNEQELCWGKVSVDKIVKASPPSGESSRMDVEYTYKIELAEWAKNEDITNNFGCIRRFLEDEGKKTRNCTLTSASPPPEDSSRLCAKPDFPPSKNKRTKASLRPGGTLGCY